MRESASDVFWIANLRKPELIYISPSYERLWGRDPHRLHKEPYEWIEAIHPEDRERVRSAFLAHADAGDYNETYRILRPDGGLRWIRDRSFPIRSAAGLVTCVAGVAEDITEQREAEERLRASEARFRTIVETAHEGVWLIDREARTLLVNARMATLLGTTPEAVAGRTVMAFTYPEDQPLARERIESNFAGHDEQFDFRFRRVDGSEVCVLACTSPVRDDTGQVVGALGMFSDLTERRRVEQALRESEATLRSFCESVPFLMGIVEAVDDDLLTVYDNSGARGLVSPPSGGMTDRLFSRLGRPPAVIRDWIARCREGRECGEPVRLEFELDEAGETRWFSATVAVIGTGPSGRTRFCYVAEDISERKRLEGERQETLKQRELMVQELNHRVKNNFQLVASLLRMQAGRITTPEARAPLLDACQRVAALADIHTSLYQDTGKLGSINFATYLRDLCTRLRTATPGKDQITLEVEAVDEHLDLDCAIPLGLIVNELVTNAFKYAFSDESEGRVFVRFQRNEGGFRLCVEDTGRGLPDPSQRSEGGLGTRLVEALVRQLGSVLRTESSTGLKYEIDFTPR